jgi:hypothetical protein
MIQFQARPFDCFSSFFPIEQKKKKRRRSKTTVTKEDPINIAEIIETTTTGELSRAPFRSMWELPPFTRQMRIEDALATILLRNPFRLKKNQDYIVVSVRFIHLSVPFFIISVPILCNARRGSYHYRGDGTLK